MKKTPNMLSFQKTMVIDSCSECDYHTMSPDHHMAVKCMLTFEPHDRQGKVVRGSDDANHYSIPNWCPRLKKERMK